MLASMTFQDRQQSLPALPSFANHATAFGGNARVTTAAFLRFGAQYVYSLCATPTPYVFHICSQLLRMRVPHAALVTPGAARGSLGLARMPCLSEALMSPAYRTCSRTSPRLVWFAHVHMLLLNCCSKKTNTHILQNTLMVCASLQGYSSGSSVPSMIVAVPGSPEVLVYLMHVDNVSTVGYLSF